ncbi:hypothetical protein GEV33_011007 [Tenebrio molitor]|uniref:Odorant receptor n=1 Tax=Tenebrio molitor TaxID=7067 RepID=A0A8J6HC58_TENMO|nr:hypothetical protein GEV33_011007 [Tenebrio molitor]
MTPSTITSLDPDDVFTDSIKMLWYGRFHPELNPRWTAVLVPINFFFCSILLVLGIKCVLVSYNSDIFLTAECLQTCILMMHAMVKFVYIHLTKKAWLALLQQKSKFWNIKDFDEEIFRDCSKVFTLTRQILRYYFIQTMIGSVLFDVQPFMTGELPTGCYVPHGWFAFLTVILWYLACVVIIAFMGMDGLFCSFAISLMVQFRLLGHKFRNLATNQSIEELSKELRELVDYHNFLISCSQKLNDTFQIVFLIQFVISIASGSVSVFILMQPDMDDILSDPLRVLWLCRYHPALSPWWTTVMTPINALLCCLIVVLAIKGILVSYNDDLFFTAECLQTCIVMVHIIVKPIIMHVHKHTTRELLEQVSKFWKISTIDKELFTECHLILKVGKLIVRYYFYMAFIGALLFMVQPFTTHQVPAVCYTPDGWFIYLTAIIWYLTCILIFLTMGADGFFCTLATALTVQFKLLGHRFKVLKMRPGPKNEQQMWDEIKELVDYHNFLISFCGKLNKMYSGVFLIQFLVSIASASVAVFILIQPSPWANQMKCLFYFMADVMETAFYCFPAEMVVNAASQVGNAVCESRWYESSLIELRKCLCLVLARTQKGILFSGNGLVWINLRTFLLVYKTGFSFYTYLNSVKKINP